MAAARFQLYNLYRQQGQADKAAVALAVFQDLKKKAEGAAIPEDVDWCVYAEVYDPPEAATARQPTAPTAYQNQVLEGTATGLLVIDSKPAMDAPTCWLGRRAASLFTGMAANRQQTRGSRDLPA